MKKRVSKDKLKSESDEYNIYKEKNKKKYIKNSIKNRHRSFKLNKLKKRNLILMLRRQILWVKFNKGIRQIKIVTKGIKFIFIYKNKNINKD